MTVEVAHLESGVGAVPVWSVPQIKLPAESVSTSPAQERSVATFRPPAVIFRPFVKVEVAVPVVLIAKTFSPPANVEVADEEVALKFGAEIKLA